MPPTKIDEPLGRSGKTGDFQVKLAKRPRISLSQVEHPALVCILSGVSTKAVARTIAALAELGAKQSLGVAAAQTHAPQVTPSAATTNAETCLPIKQQAAHAPISETTGEAPAVKQVLNASKMADALLFYD